jgi:hypothetical protein
VSRVYTQTPWRRKPALSILLGATELSKLLDRKNAAVITNWRARSSTFPAERVGGSQPRFDFVEVYEWLRDSGPRSSELPQISSASWWTQLVGAFNRQAVESSSQQTMVALVLLWHELTIDPQLSVQGKQVWKDLVDQGAVALNSGGPRGVITLRSSVRRAAEWAESTQPKLAGLLVSQLSVDLEIVPFLYDLIDALDVGVDLSASDRLNAVLDTSNDVRTRTQLRSTDLGLARLMRAVAAPKSGDTVLDPAAGEASLLLACARQVQPLRIAGQEIDEATWVTARSRLIVAGVEAEMGKPGLDSLRSDQHKDVRAQIVFIDPPVVDDGPPLERWLEFGLAHLAADGRLVIALPLSELVAVKAARRLPSKRLAPLVESLASAGMLEGLLVVPPRVRKDVVGPVVVCLFRSEASATAANAASNNRAIVVAVIDRRVTDTRDTRVTDTRDTTEMRKVLREITRRGLSSIEDNPDIGLKVRRLAAAGLVDGLRALNAASEASTVRHTRDEIVLSSLASPSDDDQRSYAPAESMSPPFRRNALEVSVRARYDDLLASNRELATRHQLLMKSVDELLKALDHIRPKMDPELAAHIDYDIYRVRRDLQ